MILQRGFDQNAVLLENTTVLFSKRVLLKTPFQNTFWNEGLLLQRFGIFSFCLFLFCFWLLCHLHVCFSVCFGVICDRNGTLTFDMFVMWFSYLICFRFVLETVSHLCFVFERFENKTQNVVTGFVLFWKRVLSKTKAKHKTTFWLNPDYYYYIIIIL